MRTPKPPLERCGLRLVLYTTTPCEIVFECWLQPAKLPRGCPGSRSKAGPVLFPLLLHFSKKLATGFLVIFLREGWVEDLNRRQSVQFRSLDVRDQPDSLSFMDHFHYIAV